VIFQDHTAVLDPMMAIGDIIGEGIDIHKLAQGQQRNDLIASLLRDVDLPESFMDRYPHELSGGQKQRVGIARALAVEPDIIVCDEPLSALDMCTQEQILDLLKSLKKKRQLTYLFITHDLDAVRGFADRVIELGRL
jgi:oligopeptide transport system ATP-binding protein